MRRRLRATTMRKRRPVHTTLQLSQPAGSHHTIACWLPAAHCRRRSLVLARSQPGRRVNSDTHARRSALIVGARTSSSLLARTPSSQLHPASTRQAHVRALHTHTLSRIVRTCTVAAPSTRTPPVARLQTFTPSPRRSAAARALDAWSPPLLLTLCTTGLLGKSCLRR